MTIAAQDFSKKITSPTLSFVHIKECYLSGHALKIGKSSVKISVQTRIGKVILTISRKYIFSQSERFHFQTFSGEHAPGPPNTGSYISFSSVTKLALVVIVSVMLEM